MMKSITECTHLKGAYVIVRSSCNVPLVGGKVGNTFRLRGDVPTLEFLRAAGARVIVIAHIGRDATDTLRPVLDAFQTMLPMTWGGSITDTVFMSVRDAMNDGDIILCENIRQDEREHDNDLALAELIASYGDVYVNDAFDNIHREHATMVSLPRLLPAYAGLNLIEEVTHVTKVMSPEHPSLFILGGAKFETKMPLVEKYLTLYDYVFVGGALANDILQADGYEVGSSLVSEISLAGHPMLTNKKLIRPVDVVVRREGELVSVLVDAVVATDVIVDMGERTVAMLAPYIARAKSILWNGPMGKYEEGTDGSTHAIARMVADSNAYSVLGGGDTAAAVEELGLNDRFGFVSSGGGAMLTLLEHGTTPALTALGYEA